MKDEKRNYTSFKRQMQALVSTAMRDRALGDSCRQKCEELIDACEQECAENDLRCLTRCTAQARSCLRKCRNRGRTLADALPDTKELGDLDELVRAMRKAVRMADPRPGDKGGVRGA